MAWTSLGVIYSLEAFNVPSLATFQQRGQQILSIHHLFQDHQFDLDLWPCVLKFNMGHLLSISSTVPSLATFHQRGQEILNRRHLYKDQQFDLGPCDLKINRGHLISRGIHCTKFGNFQMMESKDIEWTLLGPQTPCPSSAKQYALGFQRGHNKMINK